jgi:hypothetical protein
MINKTKKALNRLENAYKREMIIYPGVDNDYLKGTPYSFYAHPKLNEFDEYSTPLKRNEYEFNVVTLPLHFCNKRIIKASLIGSTIEFVKNLFDENLKPLNETELKRKNETYRNFLTKNELNPTYYYQKYFFKPRNLKGFRIKRKNKTKITAEKKDFKKINSKVFQGLKFQEIDSFQEVSREWEKYFFLYEKMLFKPVSLVTDC